MAMELQFLKSRNRAAWRRWLEKHHATCRGVWFEFYKKHTGKASITYPEALEEALCFGWIDSILKRIDDERYMQKFTPRVNPRKWSAVNLRHMQRLIEAGEMTDAGLRVLGVPLDQPGDVPTRAKTRSESGLKPAIPVPEFVQAAIDCSPRAEAFWSKLSSGCRRRYLTWILGAKREDTRRRRLAEAIACLEAGTKSIVK